LSQTKLYSSILAKIGAERSKLLSEAKLKALTETRNLGEFVAQLQDTIYKEQTAKIAIPVTSRKIERAVKEKQIETYINIIKSSPERSEDFLRLHITRFEVENIKTLIKAVMTRLSREQKLSKIYLSAEGFLKKRAVFEEAAEATDVKEVVTAFDKTQYGATLKMGLDSYEENGATACLDVLLDKQYYEKLYDAYQALPTKDKAHAYFYASTEIDSYVLLTLLRAKNLKYDVNWLRLAVPTQKYKLPEETVEAMVTADNFDSALKIAQQTYYGRFFSKSQTSEETVANAENTFKKALLNHAKEGRLTELFNIGAALAFMTQKGAEVNNLIVASLGVEAALTPEEIQRQMQL